MGKMKLRKWILVDVEAMFSSYTYLRKVSIV